MVQRGSRGGTGLKSFRNLMTFRLHRLANASERFSEEYYRKLTGLSLVECRVIGILAGLGTGTFKEVCELVRLDKSFGSRVIQRLTDAGILLKEVNPIDQRSVLLRLTEHGENLQSQLHASAVALNREMLAPLTDMQAQTLLEHLRILTERLEDLEAQGFEAPVGKARARLKPAASERDEDDVEVRLDTETVKQLYQLLGGLLKGGA